MCDDRDTSLGAVMGLIGAIIGGLVALSFVWVLIMSLFWAIIVVFCWNSDMVAAFGLGSISYWQAYGLTLLCRILLRSGSSPNMNWNNVIGIDSQTPYDANHMKNLEPNGAMSGDDRPMYQSFDCRPTPELANHRAPVKNLYCTGGSWWVG